MGKGSAESGFVRACVRVVCVYERVDRGGDGQWALLWGGCYITLAGRPN